MSGRREWPRGANAGPTRPVNSCSCGAMSTGPLTPDTHRCRPVVTSGRDRDAASDILDDLPAEVAR